MNEELTPRDEELLLQFGQLLDRAAGEFDESALLAKLQDVCIEEAAPQPTSVSRPQRPWLLPASIAGGVVAATILFLLFQNFLNFELPPGEQAPGIAKNP